MKNKPPKVHEFDPELYPVRLWVIISNNTSVLSEDFKDANNNFELNIKQPNGNGAAVTLYVRRKGTVNYGAVILILSRKELDYETVAHESTHAASIFWRHIGETEWGEEANAYLTGWVAKCIEIAKNYKNETK